MSLASPSTHHPSGHILRRWVRNIQMFIKSVLEGFSDTHVLGSVLLPLSGDRWAGMRQNPLQDILCLQPFLLKDQ